MAKRAVSLSSGKSVEQALKAVGFQVTLLDPSNKEDLKTLVTNTFDVAFLALHGKGGETALFKASLKRWEFLIPVQEFGRVQLP